MYSGLIIKESISDEQILDKLDVVSVELWKTDNTPRYWTAISFTSNSEDFPEQLSKALYSSSDSGMVWYVDFKDDVYKYIVLKDVVLRYHPGNDDEKRSVCERCIESGVRREQLDWFE